MGSPSVNTISRISERENKIKVSPLVSSLSRFPSISSLTLGLFASHGSQVTAEAVTGKLKLNWEHFLSSSGAVK